MGNHQARGVDVIKKIISILKKDSVDHNESNKNVLIIRLLSIVMCVYFVILIIMFVVVGEYALALASFLSGGGYVIVLSLTYYNRSLVAYWVQNLVTLIWLTFFVLILGWGCGAQHFLFLLVVLTCFAIFERTAVKVSYIVFLCIFRIILYFYVITSQPLVVLSPVLSAEFQVVNTIIIFLCITIISLIVSDYTQEAEKKLVLYNKTLEKMAHVDELTGLLNRRSMISYLEAYDNSKRTCTDTIAIGDIDFFKKVNDQYGHECGDVVLKELSELLKKEMEGKGMVARWGGEEFLFVFEQRNGDDALLLLWEILQKIRATTIVYQEWNIHITMTFGLEEYNGTDYEQSIKKADDKLYMGKTKGRNQIVF